MLHGRSVWHYWHVLAEERRQDRWRGDIEVQGNIVDSGVDYAGTVEDSAAPADDTYEEALCRRAIYL